MKVPSPPGPKLPRLPWVYPRMYRDSLLGLTEQIRTLTEVNARLEADLARLRRITGPQRVLRAVVAGAIVVTAMAFAGALGYSRAAEQLRSAAHADAITASHRIAQLNRELAEARDHAEGYHVSTDGLGFELDPARR
jgi:hypothetical protein